MARSREMFKRVRGSICVLKRSIPRAQAQARKTEEKDHAKQPAMRHTTLLTLSPDKLELSLDDHTRFLRWYILFLRDELIPTASYQRHVGSLKALSNILRMEEDPSKQWETLEDQELFFDLFDASWARALYDLIMDPFEDVRELAAAALRVMLSQPKFRCFKLGTVSSLDELQDLERRCDAQARRTARADDSDGAARAAQVVYKAHGSTAERFALLSGFLDHLESRLDIAEKDLGRAVLDAPVHGKFAALRYVWQVVAETKFSEDDLKVLQGIQNNIVECCERVWAAVRDILCDDSPEGHLPQELEEVDGLTTRDVLSYSFRSVHESRSVAQYRVFIGLTDPRSNLMRAIALTLRHGSSPDTISPSANIFRRLSNLTFDQLSTLRHRGAFTTVSQTFATCCQQTKYLNADLKDGDELLNTWYQVSTKRLSGLTSFRVTIFRVTFFDLPLF